MGDVYVDDNEVTCHNKALRHNEAKQHLDKPHSAMAVLGDFCFFAGEANVIDTRENHRRRGLAYVCGARLILECLDRGLYPSWDAQNKASVALAEKLGYHYSPMYLKGRLMIFINGY